MISKFALLCLGVLAFAGGMLANRWIGSAPAPSSVAPSSPPAVETARADEVLVELAAEVRRLRQTLEQFAAGAATREPAGNAAQGNADEIHLLVEELRSLVRSAPDRRAPVSGARTPELVLPPPGLRPRAAPRVIDLEEGGNMEQVNREHILWTYQDLLDAYGRPDEISQDGNGLEWLYQGDGYRTRFYFADGLLLCVGGE